VLREPKRRLRRRLLAGVNVHRASAGAALDAAAPVELAVASLADRRLLGVVAAAAAQQVAPVQPVRCTVACTTVRS
jgi:hypothetical protein